MAGLDFFDTNILVYAYDSHYPDKQKRAQDMVADAIRSENAMISTHVLGEFFTVVTKKIQQPMSVNEAAEIVGYLALIDVLEIDLLIVKRAMETVTTYNISYWDSLIVAAAERGRCETIITEDLNDGQEYHGIKVVNPFS